MYMSELTEGVNNLAVQFLEDNATAIPRSDVVAAVSSLDPRAIGGTVYVGEDYIAVIRMNARVLDYYGGFEYVDDDQRVVIGDYVFYTADSERVRCVLDELTGLTEEQEEDEEN
jgi:hypothetical protein